MPFDFSKWHQFKFRKERYVMEVSDNDATEHMIYSCVRSKLSHTGSAVVIGLIPGAAPSPAAANSTFANNIAGASIPAPHSLASPLRGVESMELTTAAAPSSASSNWKLTARPMMLR